MTSSPRQAFVWVWLPEKTEPVVAGRLDHNGEIVTFTYGRSYLSRADAVPLYLPELPLERGSIAPLAGEIAARYASYADLADAIRARFTQPARTLRELFARIVFNVLTGNTDDHPRNHAAFWDGSALTLTPAYDICPQPRAGGECAQIMAIGRDGWRMSQVAGCVARAATYLLSEHDAREIVEHQLEVIAAQWDEVCDAAALPTVDRAYFWRRQFLNPYALEGCR